MKTNTTLIIPAYNEAESINSVLDSLIKNNIHQQMDVLVVNDGSTDKTSQIVKKYPIKIISHTQNKGYGAALKTGIRYSQTEFIITMDSDGQHSIKYLDQLKKLLPKHPLVIGERTDESSQHQSRLLGKAVLKKLGQYLLEQDLPDFNSGFRGFHRQKIFNLLHLMPNGFSFSTTSTFAFYKLGHDVATFPIKTKKRQGRPSNLNLIKDGSKTLLLIMRIIMLFNPLKLFFPASLTTTFLGLSWALYGFIIGPRVPNSSILITVLGMLLFFFGLLADQISMLNLKQKST